MNQRQKTLLEAWQRLEKVKAGIEQVIDDTPQNLLAARENREHKYIVPEDESVPYLNVFIAYRCSLEKKINLFKSISERLTFFGGDLPNGLLCVSLNDLGITNADDILEEYMDNHWEAIQALSKLHLKTGGRDVLWFHGRSAEPHYLDRIRDLIKHRNIYGRLISNTNEVENFLLLNEYKTNYYNEAILCYEKSMELEGSSHAFLNAGILYARGLGVAKNNVTAAKLIMQSIQRFNALGNNHKEMSKAEEILNNILNSVTLTGEEALLIGNICYSGNSQQGREQINKNYPEAMKWYQKAIILGNKLALVNTAYLFEYGAGVEKNVKTAASYYLHALHKMPNQVEAKINLSRLIDKINNVDDLGWILHNAVYSNNPEVAKILVDKGANLTLQESQVGNTALHIALYNKQYKIAEVICSSPHNVVNYKIKNNYNNNALELCANLQDADLNGLYWILEKAENENNLQIVRKLISNGANVNLQDPVTGNTPLHQAINSKHFNLACLLFYSGANLTIKNKQNKSALDLSLSLVEADLHNAKAKNYLALLLAIFNPEVDRLNQACRNIMNNDLEKRRDFITEFHRPNKRSFNYEKDKIVKKIHSLIEQQININKIFDIPEISPLLRITTYGLKGRHDRGELGNNKLVIVPNNTRNIVGELSLNVACQNVLGVYKPANETIYLAANEKLEIDDIHGTLVHELSHFVMSEVFKNDYKPYSHDDETNKDRFTNICENVRKNRRLEDLSIDSVFTCKYYIDRPVLLHGELIVRVSELLATNELKWRPILQTHYADLLNYYHDVVLPACNNHLNSLREKYNVRSHESATSKAPTNNNENGQTSFWRRP